MTEINLNERDEQETAKCAEALQSSGIAVENLKASEQVSLPSPSTPNMERGQKEELGV